MKMITSTFTCADGVLGCGEKIQVRWNSEAGPLPATIIEVETDWSWEPIALLAERVSRGYGSSDILVPRYGAFCPNHSGKGVTS